jgi:hypothetical protein
MNLPTDPITWLKVAGAVSTALGSILLAWRVKEILKWVVHCLVAHEQSIIQLRNVLSNEPQTEPVVQGVTKHLLKVEGKLGVVLLVTGLLLVAIGMTFNAATYLLAGS